MGEFQRTLTMQWTATGRHEFEVPAQYTSARVIVTGAGGGGAGGTSGTNRRCGGGGGGSGYTSSRDITFKNDGNIRFYITVGRGGRGGYGQHSVGRGRNFRLLQPVENGGDGGFSDVLVNSSPSHYIEAGGGSGAPHPRVYNGQRIPGRGGWGDEQGFPGQFRRGGVANGGAGGGIGGGAGEYFITLFRVPAGDGDPLHPGSGGGGTSSSGGSRGGDGANGRVTIFLS